MIYRALVRSTSFTVFCMLLLGVGVCSSSADSGHARIVRLSLLQGEVRFARDVKGDPLESLNATWENAELNLPIRQGDALATDKGRAEVEFENGAMAFLGEDTVLEFYDLSNSDGTKTTRLVLRQGTASFYVNPGNGDYFSVTGGDFTATADGRAEFRLDNFDDGSTVNVAKGRVSVVHKDKTSELAKGQSLTMRAGDDNSVSISRLPGSDDFDRWVSGRVDATNAAVVSAQQYTGSGGYTSGLADLYTYGSWYPVNGYGNCWRPYGVGLGWAPFGAGGWYNDPFVGGFAFMGNQPWGWLPYHFGGWVFDPFYGWLWTPGAGFYGGSGFGWVPSTGVVVRSRPGFVGIVPVHPLDARGKTPINLARGVFPVSGGAVGTSLVPVNTSEQWKVVKAKDVPSGTVATAVETRAAAPERLSRTVTLNRNSSITYDAREHRFVNANTNAAAASTARSEALANTARTSSPAMQASGVTGRGVPTRTSVPAATAPTRASVAVPRSITPPPAPRSASTSGRSWGGAASSSGTRGGWSASAPSAASSGATRASAPSAPSGGGRPH